VSSNLTATAKRRVLWSDQQGSSAFRVRFHKPPVTRDISRAVVDDPLYDYENESLLNNDYSPANSPSVEIDIPEDYELMMDHPDHYATVEGNDRNSSSSITGRNVVERSERRADRLSGEGERRRNLYQNSSSSNSNSRMMFNHKLYEAEEYISRNRSVRRLSRDLTDTIDSIRDIIKDVRSRLIRQSQSQDSWTNIPYLASNASVGGQSEEVSSEGRLEFGEYTTPPGFSQSFPGSNTNKKVTSTRLSNSSRGLLVGDEQEALLSVNRENNQITSSESNREGEKSSSSSGCKVKPSKSLGSLSLRHSKAVIEEDDDSNIPSQVSPEDSDESNEVSEESSCSNDTKPLNERVLTKSTTVTKGRNNNSRIRRSLTCNDIVSVYATSASKANLRKKKDVEDGVSTSSKSLCNAVTKVILEGKEISKKDNKAASCLHGEMKQESSESSSRSSKSRSNSNKKTNANHSNNNKPLHPHRKKGAVKVEVTRDGNCSPDGDNCSEYALRHPKRNLGIRSLSSDTAPEEKAG